MNKKPRTQAPTQKFKSCRLLFPDKPTQKDRSCLTLVTTPVSCLRVILGFLSQIDRVRANNSCRLLRSADIQDWAFWKRLLTIPKSVYPYYDFLRWSNRVDRHWLVHDDAWWAPIESKDNRACTHCQYTHTAEPVCTEQDRVLTHYAFDNALPVPFDSLTHNRCITLETRLIQAGWDHDLPQINQSDVLTLNSILEWEVEFRMERRFVSNVSEFGNNPVLLSVIRAAVSGYLQSMAWTDIPLASDTLIKPYDPRVQYAEHLRDKPRMYCLCSDVYPSGSKQLHKTPLLVSRSHSLYIHCADSVTGELMKLRQKTPNFLEMFKYSEPLVWQFVFQEARFGTPLKLGALTISHRDFSTEHRDSQSSRHLVFAWTSHLDHMRKGIGIPVPITLLSSRNDITRFICSADYESFVRRNPAVLSCWDSVTRPSDVRISREPVEDLEDSGTQVKLSLPTRVFTLQCRSLYLHRRSRSDQ